MILLTAPKIQFSKKISSRILGKTKRWVIQGGILVPFTAIIPAQTLTYILKKRYPPLSASKVIVICTNRGNKSYWIFDDDECTRLGRWCMTHPAYVAKMYKRWKIDRQAYYDIIQKLSTNGIQDPLNDFLKFYQVYLYEFSAPLIQEYYSLASDEYIRQLILKYGHSAGLRKSIDILTRSPKLSFLQSAELAMVELAIKLVGKKLPRTLFRFRQRFPAMFNKLKKIQKEFFWIHFSYRDTRPHSLAYFYNQVFKLSKNRKPRELKKRYNELKAYEESVPKFQKSEIKRSLLTRKETRVLKSIGFITYWQDERKRANLLGNYWCNNFLQCVARKGKYDMDELRHLLPSEFVSLLRGNRLSRKEIRQRIKGSLYFVFASGREGITIGSPYRKLWHHISQMNHPGKITELSGIAASAGKYKGRVRKIETPGSQGKRMKPGEILVAYMTRPDFVPLMHKAGAIITDEGGLTSHAAIISRELKVPCVVGTRFAMRVLKDGDRVEVDADKGIIKKL